MYTILPFQFSRFTAQDVLLVNECGDFHFMDYDAFDLFVRQKLDTKSETFLLLKSRLFVAEEETELALEKMAAKYRSKKAFLRDFTTLHIDGDYPAL